MGAAVDFFDRMEDMWLLAGLFAPIASILSADPAPVAEN
jgi:hypothetical protein